MILNSFVTVASIFSEQIIYIHFILKKMLKFVWSCGIMYVSERDNTWLCAFFPSPIHSVVRFGSVSNALNNLNLRTIFTPQILSIQC